MGRDVRRRVVVAVLLLALLGVAACGDEPESAVAVPEWAHVAPEQIAEAKKHGVPVAFENDLRMRFVLIPAGTFLMGPAPQEPLRAPGEVQRKVSIPRPFYVQTTEVTNWEYRQFRPDYDSGTYEDRSLDAERQPVVRVTWEDTRRFAAWLSERDSQRTYMLPSEDQWEYACRARSTTAYWWGDDAEGAVGRANCADKSLVQLWHDQLGPDHIVEPDDAITGEDGYAVAAPVGSLANNRWGLHDMIGNVFEWCAKGSPPLQEKHHAIRGGSWFHGPQLMRCAVRAQFTESETYDNLGFRLASPMPEYKDDK